jgi:hypothetical protein
MRRSNDKQNINEKETNIMNKQDNRETKTAQTLIEDLTVNKDVATDVKGGPIFMRIDGIDGDVTSRGHEKLIEL